MRAGAFAVVFDDTRQILFGHRRDIDAWNLPAGGVESGDAPWDAVLREGRKEVGVDAEDVRLTRLYWKPELDELVFSFGCRIVSGTPTTSDEADQIGNFRSDDLPSNTGPTQVERVCDAIGGGPATIRGRRGAGMRELFGVERPA